MPSRRNLRSLIPLRTAASQAASGLPALIAEAARAAESQISGDHRQRKPGPGERFWQFRPYDSGDRPQDIDWRQTAKGDAVTVRQRERQTAQTVLFWTDPNPGMAFSSRRALPEKQDLARILVLALAMLVTRAGDRIALWGTGTRPGHTERAIETMAETLLHQPHPHALPDLMVSAGTLPPHAQLVLAGDFLLPPDTIESALAPLSARLSRGILLQILDPAEIDLPYEGVARFHAAGQSKDYLIEDVAGVRDAYRTRIRAQIDAVEEIARRQGWVHVLHVTGTPPEQTLSALWRILQAERERGHA